MKILLVSINHAPEQISVGKLQGEMAAWFAARGHEVRVITAPPYYPEWKIGAGYSGWKYKTEIIDGAKVYRAPLYVPSTPGGMRRVLHLLSFALSSLPLLLWQAAAWKPDAIMTTMPPMSVAPGVWLAARLSGARPYLHVHDFETDAAFHLGLLRRSFMFRLALAVERRLLRAFPAVSTISPRMRQRLIEKGVPPRNAFLIPNWASVGDFEPMQGPGAWPERLKKNPQTIVALYSGNVGRKQGIETIVAAARILKDDPNILFVISGDGAARREIEDSARDLTNIAFLPVQPLKEFRHLMIAADIHLLPQRSEAADLVMPSKLGNILASGRPVVAGALPGTQVYEAIEGCGVAVAPDNAEAFAAAISAIARDAGMRAEMGHQGRRRALAEWGKESILLQLEKLLGTIVPPS